MTSDAKPPKEKKVATKKTKKVKEDPAIKTDSPPKVKAGRKPKKAIVKDAAATLAVSKKAKKDKAEPTAAELAAGMETAVGAIHGLPAAGGRSLEEIRAMALQASSDALESTRGIVTEGTKSRGGKIQVATKLDSMDDSVDEESEESEASMEGLDEDGTMDMAEAMQKFFEENPHLHAQMEEEKAQEEEDGPPLPLTRAALLGIIDEVKVLLATGVEVDVPDKDGWTALMAAASEGQTACIEYLLLAGAKVDGLDKEGCSPLMLAAEYNHMASIKALVAAGADLDMRDCEKKTALMHAVVDGQLESVRLLCQLGADPLLEDCYCMTALQYAVQLNHEHVAQFLQIEMMSAEVQMEQMNVENGTQTEALPTFKSYDKE
jgi:hypothetical protein